MSTKEKQHTVELKAVSEEAADLLLRLARAAATRPDLVAARAIVGPPTRPNDQEGAARELAWWREHGRVPLRSGEIALSEHETTSRSRAGVQRVRVRFVVRADALHALIQLDPDLARRVARLLVDATEREKLH